MRDLSEVGLDSQCLTYLITALEGVAAPTDGLAEQKVALVRLYLYTPGTLWVTPTVEREFLRIRNEAHRASHVSWTSVLFGVRPLNDAAAVERRAASLEPHHADHDDRLVLAEAEDIGFASLASFDAKFVNHLAKHARLLLMEPAALWASLGIPRGARPDKLPAFGWEKAWAETSPGRMCGRRGKGSSPRREGQRGADRLRRASSRLRPARDGEDGSGVCRGLGADGATVVSHFHGSRTAPVEC